ncbi:MAG: hypothetical protein WBN00_09555 [Sedimenticolaceae bacterium]
MHKRKRVFRILMISAAFFAANLQAETLDTRIGEFALTYGIADDHPTE